MGYEVYLEDHQLEIECETEEQVIQAVKDAGIDISVWDGSRPSETVQELLESFGFQFSEYGIGFEAKWRSQEDFFRALAPFVKDESYLHFLGEDSERFGYVFRAGDLIPKTATITWTEAVA